MSERRELGFIMLRHVNSEKTNMYWIKSYESIRRFYPENKIMIVDDNSNYEYVSDIPLHNTTIVNSEYKGRGELLPYYYYLRNRLFDVAVIIHDSVFINSPICLDVDTYKYIWDFNHTWDQVRDETEMIQAFNDPQLMSFYENKRMWNGCFGGMSIVTYEYLFMVNRKYNLDKLLSKVVSRYNRCSFERVIACLLAIQSPGEPPLLGNIHTYCKYLMPFEQAIKCMNLPIIKCWTGR
jgi:hypothetical protein